ncbi:hypothetical protein [Microbulbifer sp. TYP-18]|uniref:hypothetical protein n=1 Tax=Microbulbifer sp. TYP-18 TaxID=3230024 RepID=UPI0034C6533C
MRLVITSYCDGSELQVTNYVTAKQLLKERPISVVQILQPLTCRENLVEFLSWANGQHRLPRQVILNQVSPAERRLAALYLLNQGYHSVDQVTFLKLP